MNISSIISGVAAPKISVNSQLIDILRLIRSQNVGIKTFQSLIKVYGTATKALEALPELSRKGGRQSPIIPFSKSQAEDEITATEKIGGKMLCYLDKDYPKLLKQIDDYPPIISVQGDINLLNKFSIGIVGARNASLNGCKLAAKIAKHLGKNKIIIVSGLARGIDTASHLESIETGTIAVIAGGLGHIYPPENKKLYDQISEKGAVIAELATSAIPRSQHFPQRNRIISGISAGIIVVEAGLQSGSLITARMALEQNREVFAVPGFPLDPRCQGSNKLIKQGAVIIDSIESIIDNLPNFEQIMLNLHDNSDKNYQNIFVNIDEAELNIARTTIVELLSSTPISLEELSDNIDIPIRIITIILLELEIAGKITRYPGSRFALNM